VLTRRSKSPAYNRMSLATPFRMGFTTVDFRK